MAKKDKGNLYEDLIRMAEEWNVADNTLFLAAANQYVVQQQVIELIRNEINGGNLTTEKTYLKGTTNAYASPLVRELPKHSDSANKTLSTMLDIINKLGTRSQKETALDKFAKEFE